MYHFIVNIHGASGKAFLLWKKVQSLLKEKNIEYETYVPQRIGHAAELARKISELEDEDKKIVILGGDGTVNEVINGIPEENLSKIKLGVIPTGSGNDFARGLGLPRKNYKKALELILDSKEGKKIDLGVVESDDENALFKRKLFAISSGFGLNALVGTSINNSKIKKVLNWIKLGSLSYAILTVKTLFTMKTQKVALKFDDDEPVIFDKLIFTASMNFKAEGGGVPMNPNADGSDGELSLCVAYGIPKIIAFFKFPVLCLGKHGNTKGFFLRNFKKMEISSESESVVHTDGELFGNVKTLKYSVLKNVVHVLV